MKKIPITFSIIIILSLCLTACIPFTPVPANQPVSEAFIKTAVAGTLIAERGKEAGASLSYTATPEGTLDPEAAQETQETEEGEGTDDEEEQDPQPTPDNPWMLQSWCADHEDDCVKYDVQNRTDSWLQVELKETDTGVTGFFSIKKRSLSEITLIPGKYTVKYTWWCEGDPNSLTVIKALGSWIDVFKCPQGFYQKVNKQ